MRHIVEIRERQKTAGRHAEEDEHAGKNDWKAVAGKNSARDEARFCGIHGLNSEREESSETACLSSSAVVAPGRWATIAPRDITKYRSETRIRSSNADETIRIVPPASANWTASLRISVLALTSRPRVGSSRNRSRGLVAS